MRTAAVIVLKLVALLLPTGLITLSIAVDREAHQLRLPLLMLTYASFPLAWWAIGHTFRFCRDWQWLGPVFLMVLWTAATLTAGVIITLSYGCSLHSEFCI